jgi:hypothetical protein
MDEKKDVKMTKRSQYVVENKGPAQKTNPNRSHFKAERSQFFRQLGQVTA